MGWIVGLADSALLAEREVPRQIVSVDAAKAGGIPRVKRGPADIEEEGGGQGGIRTHGRLTPTAVFKTAALNHSATCPCSSSGLAA